MIYDLLLFAHIAGALGFFGSVMLWVAVLAAVRRAQRVEDVRPLVALLLRSQRAARVSIVVLLLAGSSMASIAWGWTTDWILVTLGTLVVIAPISALFIDPQLHRIATLAQAAADGPLTDDLTQRMHSPQLAMALYGLVPLILGIVFLMVVKPALSAALIAIACAVILGIVVSLPSWLAKPHGRHTP